MKKTILYLLLVLVGAGEIKSQSLDIGIGVGGVLYWGDLNGPDFGTNVGNTNLGIQIVGNYTLSRYFSVKGGLLYGTLSGDDSKSSLDWQKERNLNFTSILIEASVLTEFHIFGYNKLDEESPFSPFGVFGVSGMYFNPKTSLDGVTHALQPLGTEGQGLPGFEDKYSRLTGAFVLGAGIKVRLSESVIMVVEGLGRRVFTDYLDDLSGDYVSYPELAAGNGEVAARLGNRIGEYLGQAEPVILETGTQRGGKFISDYFMTGMVTFYFKISSGYRGRRGGNSVKCPTF